MPKPVVIMSTIDPVLRDTALFSILTDQPGTGVLQQDLDPVAGTLRRVISDQDGVAEDVSVPLAHTCLGCAIREDALPSLESMAASDRWDRIVLALPVSAQTAPAARALANRDTAERIGVTLAAVATVVNADTVTDDLTGDDLLVDRELALSLDDRRSVGEALAGHIEHADLVLTTGSDSVGLTLADHLRGVRATRTNLFDLPPAQLFETRYIHQLAEARIDPRLVVPPDASDAHGVWTLDLGSRRPVHPSRFRQRIDDLRGAAIRSRGRFALATRPSTVGEWDGAGGQLCIGHAGGWGGFAPSTRLIFTGQHGGRERLLLAFADILLTDAEIANGPRSWMSVDDGLDDWLGERRPAA